MPRRVNKAMAPASQQTLSKWPGRAGNMLISCPLLSTTGVQWIRSPEVARKQPIRHEGSVDVDIAHEPRWSRVEQCFGEDPFLVSRLGGSSAPDGETGFLENGAARIQSIQHDFEYEKDCGEGYDRASLRLGVRQRELLREIKALGKPLVAVLIMGRPLIINEVLDQADAVLLAWYPGMMGGQAVAEALFGDYNPGGKLPVSFPLDEGQLPVYYNARRARPNYIDLPAAPRLSFGFGPGPARSLRSFDNIGGLRFCV